ncbi:hypothetical protein VTO73DRAFT_5027 [Trametes versicolor]
MSNPPQEVDRSSAGESSQPPLVVHPTGLSDTDTTSVAPDHGEPGRQQQPPIVKTVKERPEIPSLMDIYPRFMGSNDPRAKVYTPEQQKKAWSDSAETVQKWSDQMVEQWNKEIDTYLVFAGLFSAILTAFNVQSYVLLQPGARDPSTPVSAQSSSTSPIHAWAIWLNGLWFSGLVLSLASAALGISVKQWLDEYSRGLSGASRSVARARQYRLNNLNKWRVCDIVDIIPILLQLALACFLAGLLILLWTLHHTLAIAVSVFVGILAIFTIATTLLPLFEESCAYLSPQTHMLDYLLQPNHYKNWLYTLPTKLSDSPGINPSWRRARADSEPVLAALPAPRRRVERIAQLAGKLSQSVKCFVRAGSSPKPTRQGREQSTINKIAEELDIQLLVEACSFTLRPEALSSAAVCLTVLKDDDVLRFFQQLRKSTRAHFGIQADEISGPLGMGNQHQLLWLQIMLCALNAGDKSLSPVDAKALGLYAHWGQWPTDMREADAEWAGYCLSSILEHLQAPITLAPITPAPITPKETPSPKYQPSLLDGAMQAILSNVIKREGPLWNVVLQVVSSSYRAVRLSESKLLQVSSSNLTQALKLSHGYAGNVRRFLERANRALTSPLAIDNWILITIRTYTGDVLTEVARNLFKLPTPTFLTNLLYFDLIESLADQMALDGPGVLLCIPGDSIPDFVRMLDELATRSREDHESWGPYEPALNDLRQQVAPRVVDGSMGQPA